MEKDACNVCELQPNQRPKKTTLKKLTLVKTVDAKGVHRSEEGDWEAYEVTVYQCPGCKRYFKHTHSEDWEPVGVSAFDRIREITKEEAEQLL